MPPTPPRPTSPPLPPELPADLHADFAAYLSAPSAPPRPRASARPAPDVDDAPATRGELRALERRLDERINRVEGEAARHYRELGRAVTELREDHNRKFEFIASALRSNTDAMHEFKTTFSAAVAQMNMRHSYHDEKDAELASRDAQLAKKGAELEARGEALDKRTVAIIKALSWRSVALAVLLAVLQRIFAKVGF